MIAARRSAFSRPFDAPPDSTADVVWLPGGYPELHAGRLLPLDFFSLFVPMLKHGPCMANAGYMVLGKQLIDKDGTAHDMLGIRTCDKLCRQKIPSGISIGRNGTDSCLFNRHTKWSGHNFIIVQFLNSRTRHYFRWWMLKGIWCLKQGLYAPGFRTFSHDRGVADGRFVSFVSSVQ